MGSGILNSLLLAPAISGYPWSAPFRERHVRFRRIYDEQGADALIAATVDAPTFAPSAAGDPALRSRLVGLMQDSAGLFALDPADIDETTVLYTVVAGRSVHQDPGFTP